MNRKQLLRILKDTKCFETAIEAKTIFWGFWLKNYTRFRLMISRLTILWLCNALRASLINVFFFFHKSEGLSCFLSCFTCLIAEIVLRNSLNQSKSLLRLQEKECANILSAKLRSTLNGHLPVKMGLRTPIPGVFFAMNYRVTFF